MSIRIIEVIVGAGTGFNNPFEQYSNFKPSVTLKAVLNPAEMTAEEFDLYVKDLQAKAQSLVMDERKRILSSLEREVLIAAAKRDVESLSESLASCTNVIATFPQRIETYSARANEKDFDDWELKDMQRSLSSAQERIEPLRVQLGEATAKLYALHNPAA